MGSCQKHRDYGPEKHYDTRCGWCEAERLQAEIAEWKHRAVGGTCRILSDPDCDCSLCKRDKEIERLRVELDKFPQTKDGVPVYVGMKVYYHYSDSNIIYERTIRIISWGRAGVWLFWAEKDTATGRALEDCYSTREAAQEAKETECSK
jgi:hypothetical protein